MDFNNLNINKYYIIMVNIDYDNVMNNVPYKEDNTYEDNTYEDDYQNITDTSAINDDNNYIFIPFIFVMSICTMYSLCYLFDSYKKLCIKKNNINLDSLNTIIVFTELQDNICSICLDDFKNEDILNKLNCDHMFHKNCLGSWLNDNNISCPLCRAIIN